MFKSTDGGANWTSLINLSGYALAIDPINTNTVYAGTYHGVRKSTDSGTTWSAFNTGLTNLNVYALAIDPTMLYAGTYYGGAFALQHRAGVYLPLVLRNP